VSKYLSDWPKAWDEVTIHHVLSHTGGLPRLTTQVLLDVSGLGRATPSPFRGIRDLLKPGEEVRNFSRSISSPARSLITPMPGT
jgi:CubicO group peptidase (beta-lactamase class C family)